MILLVTFASSVKLLPSPTFTVVVLVPVLSVGTVILKTTSFVLLCLSFAMHLYVTVALAVKVNVLPVPETFENVPVDPFFCHVYVIWSCASEIAVTLSVTDSPFFAI